MNRLFDTMSAMVMMVTDSSKPQLARLDGG